MCHGKFETLIGVTTLSEEDQTRQQTLRRGRAHDGLMHSKRAVGLNRHGEKEAWISQSWCWGLDAVQKASQSVDYVD